MSAGLREFRAEFAEVLGRRYSQWAAGRGLRTLLARRPGATSRLPRGSIETDLQFGYQLDGLIDLGNDELLVAGWVWDEGGPVDELSLLTRRRARTDLRGSVSWIERPDLLSHFPGMRELAAPPRPGFLGMVPVKRGGEAARMRVRTPRGGAREYRLPPPVRDPYAARETMLRLVPSPSAWSAELVRKHLVPAATLIADRCGGERGAAETVAFGDIPSSPEVTIIVPLYRRTDFLEHQLACFADDRELRDADLIYVLDSPEHASELRERAFQLSQLYDFPFRLMVLDRNVGYGPANNRGAEEARGRLLLFLNSDVFPLQSGWLGRLVAAHKNDPRRGATGPKLLFDDGTIQHAGLAFTKALFPPWAWNGNVWYNDGLYKGFSRNHPGAGSSRRVPAVTGACLLIDRGLFEKVAGFAGCYMVGDCEDTDLCLRLIEMGRENHYVHDVELLHLEGQSYPGERRSKLTHLNHWIQHERRGETIAAVMASFAAE